MGLRLVARISVNGKPPNFHFNKSSISNHCFVFAGLRSTRYSYPMISFCWDCMLLESTIMDLFRRIFVSLHLMRKNIIFVDTSILKMMFSQV